MRQWTHHHLHEDGSGAVGANAETLKAIRTELNVSIASAIGKSVSEEQRSDSANRELLDTQASVLVFKMFRGGRAKYSVEQGAKRWIFSFLFAALGKFERLTAKEAQ